MRIAGSVIERMNRLWDYLPRATGEQIFERGTTPGSVSVLVNFGTSQKIPQNLEQDKEHLKEFGKVWRLYTDGPTVCAQAAQLEERARRLTRDILTSPTNEVEPPYRLIEKFTTDIVDRVDSRNRGQVARDFDAGNMNVQFAGAPVAQYPSIDTETLDAVGIPVEARKWSLDMAKKLAEVMNLAMADEGLKEIVRKKRLAWEDVARNKTDFQSALANQVVQPAINSNYQTPALVDGVCSDCRALREKRIAFIGS